MSNTIRAGLFMFVMSASLTSVAGCAGRVDTPALIDACLATLSSDGSYPSPQSATAEDMRIFAPYIGTFRSQTQLFDDGETEYYFTIDYAWFDRGKTIVKFKVEMVIPSQDRAIPNTEGYYGFDPSKKELYVFGVFSNSRTGWGTIGKFNHETGARSVLARSMGNDGLVTHVRDNFELIDVDSWKNKTSICQLPDAEWKVVNEDVYTRVEN